MIQTYKILTINPGSTSTKIALFENEEKVFGYTVEYDMEELEKYPTISSQLPYRLKNIDEVLKENNISLDGLAACVGRGGSVLPLEGGTYEVNDLLLEHATVAINGVHHPAQLGTQLARIFGERYGCPVYTVNPPEVDEFEPVARVTGIKGIRRESHLHALNLKETAIRHSRENNRKYEDSNYIVCHIGGGISISAHKKGRMVDGNDIAKGLGPIAPTRCGTIPTGYLMDYIFESGKNQKELKALCTKNGGVADLLGTSDMKKVYEKVLEGAEEETLVWDAMIYSICKEIGAMSCVLSGKVDGILLSGGLVYNEDLVAKIKARCSHLGEVFAYPGEFEMEAMANGALRVLRGEEVAKEYKMHE